MAKILTQIEAHNIGNIRLFAGDAAELLAWAPPRSMARIDLIHPDPWPKRRHWKRRFVQDATVAAMARMLKPGGEFRFVCDIDDYCRLDAGASVALAGFSLDCGTRSRLATAVGRLHHDALRPQSRARGPQGGVFEVSENLILRRPRSGRLEGWGTALSWFARMMRSIVLVRTRASAPPHHEEEAPAPG